MIFNETMEDYLGTVENYLMDVHEVAVDFDPMGMDEYWIDDKVITINDMKDIQHQLFVLLHEAGHVILRNDPDFDKMFPGSKTSKVEILKEEVLAWEEARKLATKLQIPLGKEWSVHVRQAIMKYVHWVRL
jgi:Zn-dependent peptidase ImmA (M78 family)|tara:strand:+ start:747 stop:1139 length:393 start_codon:yes stop_codon:yes gene_type:complete